MFDNITDLISEANRQGVLDGDDHVHTQWRVKCIAIFFNLDDIMYRENCLYKGYRELIRWIPGLQELLLNLNNMSVLDSITKQVTLGTLVFNWIFDHYLS